MTAAERSVIFGRSGPWRRIAHVLSCIRLDEVLILQGTPLIGALFSIDAMTRAKALDVLALIAASSCLVAHVFVVNDLCATSTDIRDPNRAARVFTVRGIEPKAASYISALLLALSLILLSPFGSAPLALAIALAILSALYSAPSMPLKGVPLANSLLHLLGGLLHFLLGYSLFHAVDRRGLEIGGFFALTFAAGHLTHEARDWGSDRLNGIRTNAVRFGPVRSFRAGFILFTAADILLVTLAIRGVVPHVLVIVSALYPIHLWWTLRTAAAGLTFENIRRLQVRYRALYATIGVIMIVAVVKSLSFC